MDAVDDREGVPQMYLVRPPPPLDVFGTSILACGLWVVPHRSSGELSRTHSHNLSQVHT